RSRGNKHKAVAANRESAKNPDLNLLTARGPGPPWGRAPIRVSRIFPGSWDCRTQNSMSSPPSAACDEAARDASHDSTAAFARWSINEGGAYAAVTRWSARYHIHSHRLFQASPWACDTQCRRFT